MKYGLEIEIGKLEKEIEKLPSGDIVFKRENGVRYPYHVWEKDGHESSVYLNESALNSLLVSLRERTKLEEKLLEDMELLKARMDNPEMFHTSVLVGEELGELAGIGRSYHEHRDWYENFLTYLYDRKCRDVLILYGSRNTGKRILMSQVIADMSQEDRNHTAFIRIEYGNVMDDLRHDLAVLRDHGIEYVFIDEVTSMPNFIRNASVLGNYFSYSMKIVISGSEILGLLFAHRDGLLNRSVLLHTNYWSFPEWSRISGSVDVDRYLETSGFHPAKGIAVDSAWHIAQDIENSVVNYRGIGNLRKLETLRMKGELTYAIQRILEDMTLDFLEGVGNEEFHDNLKVFMKARDEYHISASVLNALEGYLADMDIIVSVAIKDVMDPESEYACALMFIQPGLRYLLAMDIVDKIAGNRSDIVENDIRSRILSEAVFIAAKLKVDSFWYRVFRLKGEGYMVDMVIWDAYHDEVHLFKVDGGDSPEKEFLDDILREHVEDRYGKIVGRYVIYRGESCRSNDGVEYIKADELLKKLDEIELPEHVPDFIID